MQGFAASFSTTRELITLSAPAVFPAEGATLKEKFTEYISPTENLKIVSNYTDKRDTEALFLSTILLLEASIINEDIYWLVGELGALAKRGGQRERIRNPNEWID